MINKKRQELIIQNLNSISTEVRIKSIEQLLQLPQLADEEKIEYLKPLIADSEESVRQLTIQTIQNLGGNLSELGQLPAVGEETLAAPESAFSPLSVPLKLPTIDELPQEVPTAITPPSPTVADFNLPDPVLPPVTDFNLPDPVSAPVADFNLPDPVSAPVAPLPKKLSPATFVDDPVDPALPDFKKISDIPALFQHIKMLSDKKPSGYLTCLLQLAGSALEEVALTALQALLNLKEPRIATSILAMLADDQYSSQRRFLMLKVILDLDQDLDAEALQDILLREKDVIVKSGLVKVFARSSRESGIPTLILCLEDQDPRVRANTVEVIEEQAIRGCEQKIIQLLNDPENRVKVNAAKYLVKNGFQQAFLTLRTMLVSPEVWLRDSVIFALGEIGDQASLTLLKAALKDPNQGIRLSVLKALARINNNTSRQVLKAACGDPDPVVAQVANSLFEKIKDTPMRDEIRQIQPTFQTGAAAPVTALPPKDPQPIAPAMPDLPAMPSLEPQSQSLPLPAIESTLPVTPPLPPTPMAPAMAIPRSSAPVQMSELSLPTALPAESSLPSVSSSPLAPPPRANVPASPLRPPTPVVAVAAKTTSGPGEPVFAKPRSLEIYGRLSSADVNEQRSGARDIAFVMGDDQMILLAKAVSLSDESIRIAAVKVLSRKKTPEVRDILQKLLADANETVRSMAEKALLLLK